MSQKSSENMSQTRQKQLFSEATVLQWEHIVYMHCLWLPLLLFVDYDIFVMLKGSKTI